MTTPEPRVKGRFSLYDTPNGGLHLAYQVDPETEDAETPVQHFELPGNLIRAMAMLKDGKMSPLSMMRLVGSMGGGGHEQS